MKLVSSALLLALSACASAPEPAPSGPPDLTLTPGLLAPAQARFYADCIAQAAETGSYNRERDGGTLRFTCTGDVAKTFYDGLGEWSAKIGSEYAADGQTLRFSKKLIKDAYGVDFCTTGGADGYKCVVILAVGDFIEYRDGGVPGQ